MLLPMIYHIANFFSTFLFIAMLQRFSPNEQIFFHCLVAALIVKVDWLIEKIG